MIASLALYARAEVSSLISGAHVMQFEDDRIQRVTAGGQGRGYEVGASRVNRSCRTQDVKSVRCARTVGKAFPRDR